MSAVAPSRIAALQQLRCAILGTSYNPTSRRTGAKYLRARLRGPSMVGYYPIKVKFSTWNNFFKNEPDMWMVDEDENQRLVDVHERRLRGKGAPKKAKTKGVLPPVLNWWPGLTLF